MSGPEIKGWCPSLFEPMAAGDGLLVRIKPRVAGIGAAQLKKLADAAEAYGSGRIEITNRANFQLRGLSAETVAPFAEAMHAAGLAGTDAATERRRNIIAAPGLAPDMMEVAQRLEAWLEADGALQPLPSKFGFAVGLVTEAADLCLLANGAAPLVMLPGNFAVPAANPVAVARALTHSFLQLARQCAPRPTRLRGLLAAIGAEAFCADAGLAAQPFTPAPPQVQESFGLGLAYDTQNAAQLRRAADLALRFGNGWLRTTIDGGLVLPGTGADADLAEAARAAGFVIDPADPRRRIKACVGRPACAGACADVRAVAARLTPRWAGSGLLHVSGCSKGCAAPFGAAITLVATSQEDRFNIVCDQRADGVPERAGVSLQDAIEWMTERQLCR